MSSADRTVLVFLLESSSKIGDENANLGDDMHLRLDQQRWFVVTPSQALGRGVDAAHIQVAGAIRATLDVDATTTSAANVASRFRKCAKLAELVVANFKDRTPKIGDAFDRVLFDRFIALSSTAKIR